QLLVAVSERELVDTPGFEDLVEYLGGHALAVELAGAFLGVYSAETPASYWAELKAGGGIEKEASDLVRYNQTVSQAFQTLWDRLDEEVRSAWRLASCFEPEPVTSALSDAVGLSLQNRRQLQRLHLLEVDADQRWWMHRLMREFGQQVGPSADFPFAQKAFIEGCAAFSKDIALSDGFRLYLPNRTHLDTAVRLAPEVLDREDSRISQFQDRIGTALQSVGEFRLARELLEQALASALENLGDSHPSVAIRRSNLALVLQAQGDLEGAKVLLEQALASDLENLGDSHPSVARSRSNLATVLQAQGDLEGAKVLLEQALASDLENLGDSHPSVAISRSSLALVLQDQGDLDGARALARQAVKTASLQPEGSYVRTGVEAAMRGLLAGEDA
ncbi:MAG: tetratricopeptide repeat protein, partial [Deltaproteobacteria bacterium]|nr:tetratricopeptide repeat protein [Deltaproteobacteria bacterium]